MEDKQTIAEPTAMMVRNNRIKIPGKKYVKIGSEVSLLQLLKAVTIRRLWNALKIITSFFLSVILKKNITWGMPPVLTIEPTNICNLRCPLCVTGSATMTRPKGSLDFLLFKRFIDELADCSIYVIFFHQGEPYVNKQFTDYVAYAKQKGLYVTTSTNGHFFDDLTAEATVRSGLDTIIISVDGATQATYRKYRVGGDLEKVKSGIRNLATAKKRLRRKTPYIYLQFLVMQHNEHELDKMVELANNSGADRLLIKTAEMGTVEEANNWLPRQERYRRYQVNEDGFSVKNGGKGACPRPWLTTLLDRDGGIAPCCFDKNAVYSPGNLADFASFKEIWHSDRYAKFRHTLLNDRSKIDICRNCNQGLGVFI